MTATPDYWSLNSLKRFRPYGLTHAISRTVISPCPSSVLVPRDIRAILRLESVAMDPMCIRIVSMDLFREGNDGWHVLHAHKLTDLYHGPSMLT